MARSDDPFGLNDTIERMRDGFSREVERFKREMGREFGGLLGGGDSESGAAGASWLDGLDLKDLSIKALRSIEDGVTAIAGFRDETVAEVRDLTVADGARQIPLRLYRGLTAPDGAALIVFFHGGGFVAGSIDTHDGLARRLANAARAVVLSVGYRLAPEHPYPAALEDGLAATVRARRRAKAYGCDPARLVVAGDSAGGTLATVIARLLGAARKAPAAQLLFYPATDLTRARLFKDPGGGLGAVERRGIDLFRGLVMGADGDLADPNLSPLFAKTLAGLPPAYVIAGGRDPLKQEVEDYVAALKAAGVPVDYTLYPAQPHGFLNFSRVMKDAAPALDAAGRWVQTLEKDA